MKFMKNIPIGLIVMPVMLSIMIFAIFGMFGTFLGLVALELVGVTNESLAAAGLRDDYLIQGMLGGLVGGAIAYVAVHSMVFIPAKRMLKNDRNAALEDTDDKALRSGVHLRIMREAIQNGAGRKGSDVTWGSSEKVCLSVCDLEYAAQKIADAVSADVIAKRIPRVFDTAMFLAHEKKPYGSQ